MAPLIPDPVQKKHPSLSHEVLEVLVGVLRHNVDGSSNSRPRTNLDCHPTQLSGNAEVPDALVGVLRHTADGSFNSRPVS